MMELIGFGTEHRRAAELFAQSQRSIHSHTDRSFALLMLVQFFAGILAAVVISPYTWQGNYAGTHLHVLSALILGGLISSFPIFLAVTYPGRALTRHVIAVGQMLMGALLIHLTSGRIETHFHVFGSLAFLSFYRDWRVLVTATVVVAVDHFLRGYYWPRSVFGIDSVQPFRWLEHVGWVLFETLFLLVSIRHIVQQSWTLARQQCGLELTKQSVQSERDQFFDLSLDMLCVATADGYFKKLNPIMPKKLGYEMQELLSRPFLSFVHPDDQEQTLKVLERLRLGQDLVDFENRYRCSDGRYLWFSWSCRSVIGEQLLYAVARDVTARREAAEALERAKREADTARAMAENANRAKSDFLANMSHEIRTPMNAVIGLTELVLETELTSSQRDYLATVLESGESLLSIINEILDFSKIESGKITLESVPFHIREEVGDTMKSLAIRAHRKQLELAWQVEADVPSWVVGDPSRLRQVLVNLVGNAIKFTPTGEVVLNVSCSDCRDHVAELCFEIRDTGVGIPEEKLDKIFAEFEQADTSTTREYGGTGLGLSISSRLVELMGGRIQVESVIGQGSRFYFTLPLRVAEEGPAPIEHDRNLLRDVRILIVDDNATNRRIQRETVHGWSMQACEADSGPAAMSLLLDLHSRSELPRVVLSDVHMPNMDGFMLADEIRKAFDKDSIALILLTSGGATQTQSQLADVGVDALLTKPVKQSELLDTLLRAVGPIVKATPSTTKPCESEPCREASPKSGPRRVLLAEDGLANQKLAIGLLEKWGHQVTVAADGMAAIRAWETGGFDLILMDIQMPELDGIAATEIIRQRERSTGRRTPIIAMTAHALSGDRQRCLDAGMDGYISKPVRRADLEQAMLQPFN